MCVHTHTHTHAHAQWHTPHAKEFQFTSVDLLAIHLCGSSTRLCRCRCGCVPLSIDVVAAVKEEKNTQKKRQTAAAAEKKTCFDILNKPQSRRQKRRETRRRRAARCSLSLGSVSFCDSCCFDTFALRLFDSLAAQMSHTAAPCMRCPLYLSTSLPLSLSLFLSFFLSPCLVSQVTVVGTCSSRILGS